VAANLVFVPGLQPDFRQVRAGLRHAFGQLSTFFCRKPDREPQQVRWFVLVLDKWNVEKTHFKQVRSWLSTCFRSGLQLARMMECGLIALWLNTLESCFVLYVYFSGLRRTIRMRIKTRLRQVRGTCCIMGGELGVDSSLLRQLNPVNVKCGEQVSQTGLGYGAVRQQMQIFP